MTSSLDAHLRELVQGAVREALADALEDVDLGESSPKVQPETWRSRLHTVHEDTRLSLADVAEALDVSERTARRYLDGNGDRPGLPHRRGPTGLTVRAGDLRTWLEDVEDGNRFRRAGGGDG